MQGWTEEQLIAISALQHYSFCPRQCGLIHLEQCFDDNALTVRGHAVHNRVIESEGFNEGGIRVEHNLPLTSETLGIYGFADVVEFLSDGTPYPVEYKHGKRAAKIHDEIQLAAQAMCLEEIIGKAVPKGAIYYHSSRRRREVSISVVLKQAVKQTIHDVRSMLTSMKLPPPVTDNRCKNCSLIEICQPKVVTDKKKANDLMRELFSGG